MRELDADIGKIYFKDDFYYLEKIYEELVDLMEDEIRIKKRSKKHGFEIIKTNWAIQPNPYYHIQTVINDFDCSDLDQSRYVFKVKLKYIK